MTFIPRVLSIRLHGIALLAYHCQRPLRVCPKDDVVNERLSRYPTSPLQMRSVNTSVLSTRPKLNIIFNVSKFISGSDPRRHPVLKHQILRRECSVSAQTATVFTHYLTLPSQHAGSTMQFHGIVSYPHLNLILFDVAALWAE